MFGIFKNLFAQKDTGALREALKADALLVDVRTPAEFAGGSAPGAVNIPLDQIPAQLAKFKGKKPIVVFCRSGNRSGSAKSLMEQNGIPNVTNGGNWQNVKKRLMNSETEGLENPSAYWNNRWAAGETGWDLGAASPPIARFTEQYANRDAAILIPGCGNAHEAAFLVAQGFTNITLLDIAPQAVARLGEKFAGIPAVQVVCEDFFQHQGTYDLMLEQTFFCALPPEKRNEYVQQAASLLREGGRIAGVLFGIEFEKTGPPFGGSAVEYQQAFSPYFILEKMEACYNSIPPRAGSELFINLLKKEGNAPKRKVLI